VHRPNLRAGADVTDASPVSSDLYGNPRTRESERDDDDYDDSQRPDRSVRGERGFRQLRLAVNGEPAGLMVSPEGAVTDVITVEAGADGRVVAVRTVRNPKKLRHPQTQIEERGG
jgi:hypothetical protein